jgi:hypothetical protein
VSSIPSLIICTVGRMPEQLPDVPGGPEGSVVVGKYTLDKPLSAPPQRVTFIEGLSVDRSNQVRFEVDEKLYIYFVHASDRGEREARVQVSQLVGSTELFLSGTWSERELCIYVGDKTKLAAPLRGCRKFN